MVLCLLRRWKRLHLRHKAEIILVIAAPPIAFRFLVHVGLSLWAEALVYVGWAILAAQMVAYMVERDSREHKEGFEQHIEPLADELERQRVDFTRRMTGLEEQIREVDRVMRAAFAESGVELPPRRIQLSGEVAFDPPSGSAELGVWGRKWYVRLWRWTLGYARRFLKFVWG